MKKLLLLAIMWSGITVFAAKYSWEINTGGKAVFQKNEKITFSCQLLKDGKAAIGDQVSFEIRGDNNIHKKGNFKISETPWTYETSLDFSGWLFIRFSAFDSEGKKILHDVKSRGKMVTRQLSDGIGVLVEPEKLQPPMPEPADFDAFWESVKKELATVPLKESERVPWPNDIAKKYHGKLNVFDVKIACAGGKPVSGALVIPVGAKAKSCPAIVTFHGAGVSSARLQLQYASKGMIALDINAHGIINAQPDKFYRDLNKNYYFRSPDGKREERYTHWYKNDREKYYFRGMYMRLMRALEYVKSLPEWDGKNLIACGTSQGGAQAIAASALDQDVTMCRAGVPAMCDHSGALAEIPRSSGWPALYNRGENGKPDQPEVARCAAYFDGCYFARRIKCPIYITVGLLDTVCPPTSVYAMYNSISPGVKKYISISPQKGHAGTKENYFFKHLDALLGK